ncbi:MAG: cyclic-di-AMP receptor [Chloroflexota bacterium]|nr:cyclic-di-AMP receptor [Chloroflexota bacterium]
MIGADEEQVDQVLDLIRAHATSASAPEGANVTQPAAATVFVLDLEEYQRL